MDSRLSPALKGTAKVYLPLPISALNLAARVENCLRARGIERIEQLIRLSEADLFRFPKLGKRTLRDIQGALYRRGLSLGSSPDSQESGPDNQRLSLVAAEGGTSKGSLVSELPEELPRHAGNLLGRKLRQSVSALGLSVRATNCLMIAEIETVGQLAQHSETQLLGLENLGAQTLLEIRNALQGHGLMLGMAIENGTCLASTGICDESVELPDSDEPHTKVECELSTGSIAHQLLAYLRRFPEREQIILCARILHSRNTLEELGQRCNITRERIRQIEKKLVSRLQGYMGGVESDDVRALAARFKNQVGTAIPSELWSPQDVCIDWGTGLSDEDCGLFVDFIAWAAGPYEQSGEWHLADPRLRQTTQAKLTEQVDERGWVSDAAATQVLAQAGIREEHEARWLRSVGYWSIGGGWLPQPSSMLDRAEQLLHYRGQPILVEELSRLVESDSDRSLRNRLHDDERFKMISRQGHFALCEWAQYDEYTGIAEEIAEEIERQGGTATSRHLIEVLTQRYGVSPNSVYQYLSAPMFFKSADGRVRLRNADEALKVQADPQLCPGLYCVDGQWRLRVEINNETLRGSGRPLQMAVAVLVGCQPGERRVFPSPRDEIVISWPAAAASGPSLGSLKPDVVALGGSVGDFVFLTLESTAIAVRLLSAGELKNVSPATKLTLLVGLPAVASSGADRWASIASSIGLTVRGHAPTPDDVHAQLMRRNEPALARLVREDSPQSSENILDQLESMLGL